MAVVETETDALTTQVKREDVAPVPPPGSRRGLARRAVQAIDNAGRVYTVMSLVGGSAGVGAVVASVARGVTHLPLWWLLALGAGSGAVVLAVVGGMAATVLGRKLHLSYVAHSCQIGFGSAGGLTELASRVHVRNASGTDDLQVTRAILRRYRTSDARWSLRHPSRWRRARAEGTVVPLDGAWLIPRGGSANAAIQFLLPADALGRPAWVDVKVVLLDEMNHRHRGRLHFEDPTRMLGVAGTPRSSAPAAPTPRTQQEAP